MLPLIKAEFRKGRKKFTNKFRLLIAVTALLSLVASIVSYNYGFLSDSWIYTSASDVYEIENRLFTHILVDGQQEGMDLLKNGESDVFITGNRIFITDSFKSQSAGEEMKNYIKNEFTKWLYENYGTGAFPVFVRAEYLERKQPQALSPKPISQETIKQLEKRSKQKNQVTEDEQKAQIEKKIQQSLTENGRKSAILPEKQETGYDTPDTFSPPSLISKMVIAFIFIIPSLFSMQLYTSSLAEDVRMRRMEVLLSAPFSPYSLIFQKLLPYFIISVAMIATTSIVFRVNGLLFMLFPLLAFLSFQTFIALNSRSYRELTFLILVFNLFLIIYLILPSVFSGIALSDLSPVTFLLRDLSGEKISFQDFIFSNLILAGFTIMGFVLSASSLNIETLYSPRSPFGRLADVLGNSAEKDLNAFFLAFLSVFLALFLEFFLLFFGLSVPIITSFALIMLGVAVIEEALKSILIFPSLSLKRAVIVASGFFIAEKGILFLEAFKDYSMVLPGELLIFPLLLHITASSSFAVVSKRSWKAGYVLAVAIHFAYNYYMVMGT
ncbi:ABC transporter permease family protein [Geoglobus acetivorans]|uniref:Uncharacterized protein n=1 Tax=Geoglobus acetivorans TaxID=565033 RepID=A0A0A7GBI4_GEOAI|nr:hypothetical protein GACE_0156 [Geoglobus acetivorans]